MGSSLLTSNYTSFIMRCSIIVVCVASMVGLSTASYYVQGHQQMPVKYYVSSGHQHMYAPQPQVIPSINLDMDYSPSVAFPGYVPTVAVHNDGTTGSVFDSRSGSVTNVDICQASKELAKDAIEANLDILDTISKANVDETTMENIFGQDEFQSRRGGRCGFSDIFRCSGSVTNAVMKCINSFDKSSNVIDDVISCVEDFLGVGNSCIGCVCRFLKIVTRNKLRCP